MAAQTLKCKMNYQTKFLPQQLSIQLTQAVYKITVKRNNYNNITINTERKSEQYQT